MLRRLIVRSFAFLLAVGVGVIFLPVAAMLDATTREAGIEATLTGLLFVLSQDAAPDAAAALLRALWAIAIATCVAPLALVASIGELAGVRAWGWYAGATAFLAAASPWIARAAHGLERADRANALEGRVALLFFLTGAATGTVYWFAAARGPRRETPVAAR